MNTKEEKRIEQVKVLKSLIKNAVESHKALKKVTRMSQKSEHYDSAKVSSAIYNYHTEKENLFVAYTVYYMLRHGVEDVDSYVESVLNALREEKRNRGEWSCGAWLMPGFGNHHSWRTSLRDAVDIFIERLDSYIEKMKKDAA